MYTEERPREFIVVFVCCQWFRNAVTKDDLLPDHLGELLFGSLDQIYDFHCAFLKQIETRLHMWSVYAVLVLTCGGGVVAASALTTSTY